MKKINFPLDAGTISQLKIGDEVLLFGKVLVARDQAHLRLTELLKKGLPLPVSLKSAAIFYAGPTPGKDQSLVGAIGPTTSSRMDPFTPAMLAAGVTSMIGKGTRSLEVKNAIKEHQAVYFAALGGIAALYSKMVVSAEIVAFPDLGPEAIYEIDLAGLPCVVAIDSAGASFFETIVKKTIVKTQTQIS